MEGEFETEGIVTGADFLPERAVTREPLQGTVVVIGGGNTAMDVARTSFLAIADQERSRDSIIFAQAIGLAGISTFWTTGPLEAIPLLLEGAMARGRRSLRDGGVTALLALAYAEAGDWTAAEAAAADAFALPERDEHWSSFIVEPLPPWCVEVACDDDRLLGRLDQVVQPAELQVSMPVLERQVHEED